MKVLKSVIVLIVSGTILNVWLFRLNQQTHYRGGDASTLMEEFLAYGLSENIFYAVGFVKILAAVLLLVGLFYKKTIIPSATLIAFIMIVAIYMHFKLEDSFVKHLPALVMFILSSSLVFIQKRQNL